MAGVNAVGAVVTGREQAEAGRTLTLVLSDEEVNAHRGHSVKVGETGECSCGQRIGRVVTAPASTPSSATARKQ